jgi:DNA-directed RNA polymerase subunit RPC12/RpoP
MVKCVCGTEYDAQAARDRGGYDAKQARPGIYCPDCGHPGDVETALRDGAGEGTVENAHAIETGEASETVTDPAPDAPETNSGSD